MEHLTPLSEPASMEADGQGGGLHLPRSNSAMTNSEGGIGMSPSEDALSLEGCQRSEPPVKYKCEGVSNVDLPFTVSVTTLSMGLKTFKISVSGATTVGELKSLIEQQDDSCPPPNRQRLIYNKQELSNPEVRLEDLNPPAGDGAKFSMAVELKIGGDDDAEVEVTVIHFHGYSEVVCCGVDQTVGDVMEELRDREGGEKWGETQGCVYYNDDELQAGTVLRTINGFKEQPVLQFYPMPNINHDATMHPEDVGVNVDDNSRRVLDVSPLSSPSSQKWFEVRLYGSGTDEYISVTVCISQNRTVAKLKLAVQSAFLRDHERNISPSEMRLVCQAQVCGDSELVSGYRVGDRGGRDSPAIMQLYISQQVTFEGMEVEEGEDDELTSAAEHRAPGSGIRSSCSQISKTPKVLLVVFVLTLGMILLGSGIVILLTPQPSNGTCSATSVSLSSGCQNDTSTAAFRLIAKSMKFTSGTPEYSCPTCKFTIPLPSPSSTSTAVERCQQSKMELAAVSHYIPNALCESIQRASFKYVLIDAIVRRGAWVRYTTGEKIYLPQTLWGSPENAFALTDGWSAVLAKADCKLYLQTAFMAPGYNCMFDQKDEAFAEGVGCAGGGGGDSVAVRFETKGNCLEYCKNWCFLASRNFPGEGLCCSVRYAVGTGACTCGAVRNGTEKYEEGSQGKAIAADPNIVTWAGVDFAKTTGVDLRAVPDVDGVSVGHSPESCLEKCVQFSKCRTALFSNGTCELWGSPLAVYPTHQGSFTAYTILTPFDNTCSLTLPGPSQPSWASTADCQLSLWTAVTHPQDCYYEGSSTCYIGHQMTFPAVFALILTFTGSALLICFFICCSWERFAQI
eukprot:TRINITY_DN1032_c0_g1_i1.p1 TRINITY_DN1032_c0_g1~~TRINITY_DN1032_c0_g1_i1.p1  ORF type:complete len:850 (+),score=88.59 TRINITY_DN1032_c0_g1_i1:185-2734(+)